MPVRGIILAIASGAFFASMHGSVRLLSQDLDAMEIAFFRAFFGFVFFTPNVLGHSDNYIPANPLVTPAHIVPEWYLLPFYAILRAVPSQLGGVIAMGLAVNLFLLLPWLDRSPVRSSRYRGRNYRVALTLFVISFLSLGWLGLQVVTPLYTWLARFFSVVYFSFFLLMPFYTAYDKDKAVPDRVTD